HGVGREAEGDPHSHGCGVGQGGQWRKQHRYLRAVYRDVANLVIRNEAVETLGLGIEVVQLAGLSLQSYLAQDIEVSKVVTLDMARAIESSRDTQVDSVCVNDEDNPQAERQQGDSPLDAAANVARQTFSWSSHGDVTGG